MAESPQEAMAVLTAIAKRAARRRGLDDHRLLLRRALKGVGVQIWRRAAAMVHACLPVGSREAAELVLGNDGGIEDEGPAAAAVGNLIAAEGPADWLSPTAPLAEVAELMAGGAEVG